MEDHGSTPDSPAEEPGPDARSDRDADAPVDLDTPAEAAATAEPDAPKAAGPVGEEPPIGGRRRLRRGLLGTLGLGAAAWLVFWYGVVPYPRGLADGNPDRTALMEQRMREAEGRSFEIRQEWVELDEIAGNLERAVVVAEDYRFREHAGIDWVSLAEEVRWTGDDAFSWLSASDLRALARALRYVWTNRSEIRGRSTITQQLAKNLYFGTDRSFLRKAMEGVVARRLEKRLSKDRILELYLNVVEWGPGVFGAEAASQTYFGRSARSLTLDQAAALAATLPHPLTSNPAYRPGRMLWRKNLILDRIDPSRGVRIPPSPLPPPDLDLGLPEPTFELPDPRLDAPVGAERADTARTDSIRADTTRADTLRTDTTRADTLRTDTTRVDTIRTDTTRVGTRLDRSSDATPPAPPAFRTPRPSARSSERTRGSPAPRFAPPRPESPAR